MSLLLESGRLIVAGLFTLVLGWAAISDIRHRTIPNRAVLAVIGLFVPWALLHWGLWDAWALAAGLVALAVGVILYAFGIVGAGDAKLFAAVALFGGLGSLPLLSLATAITGGAIALASLAARPRRALAMFSMRGKGDWGRGIPYGVAIAAGGAVIMWTPMIGWVAPIGAPPAVKSQHNKQALQAPAPRSVR